jgi:hypothetical protein
MKKEVFEEYAQVKGQIKELTATAKDLQKKVEQEMAKEDVDKVESDFGLFFYATRRKYMYSDKVKEAETKLRELKKKEEETADFTETRSITFKA